MENKNGQGIFYGVIGVATLVVAIIGATFAYFSASAAGNGASIGGNTNNNVAANLSLEVTKMTFASAVASSNDLVPAIMDGTTGDINRALTAGCTNDGYTGCHVYKIVAGSTAPIGTANLLLNLSVTATDKGNWKYLVYTGTDTTASTVTTAATSLGSPATNVDIFKPVGGFTTNELSKTWYLMVYLQNIAGSQNGNGDGTTPEDATGSYTGSVTLQAAGGQVKANFGA